MANLGPEITGAREETMAGGIASERVYRPWETRPETVLVANAPSVRALSVGPIASPAALRGGIRTQVTAKFPSPDAGRAGLAFGEARQSEASAEESEGMDRVMRYLRDHFRENVPMKALADLVRLSLRQFHRNFKKRFGMPPNQYLIRMRVLAARDMLLSDKRPVAKIAYELGFADDTLFIRQFKARMGMTPLQYRKANR
jgi:AraC-like DNA-binding protein